MNLWSISWDVFVSSYPQVLALPNKLVTNSLVIGTISFAFLKMNPSEFSKEQSMKDLVKVPFD